jgi:hypothetical protein
MKRRAFNLFVAGAMALAMAFAAGCSMLSQTASVPAKHPEELAGTRADCGECHSDVSAGTLKAYSSFKHGTIFVKQHGFYARQGQNLCTSCHKPAFCAECHTRRPGMSPATRNADRPDRMAPHRGDYVMQHRIDGRVDPGSCVRCHGNKADGRCRGCHK